MHILFSVHILSSLPSVVRHDCFAVLLMLNITGLSSKRKLTVQKAGVKDINTLSSQKKNWHSESLYLMFCFVFFPHPITKISLQTVANVPQKLRRGGAWFNQQ